MVKRWPKRHNAMVGIRVLKEGCPKIWRTVGPQAKPGYQRYVHTDRGAVCSFVCSSGSGSTTANSFSELSAAEYKPECRSYPCPTCSSAASNAARNSSPAKSHGIAGGCACGCKSSFRATGFNTGNNGPCANTRTICNCSLRARTTHGKFPECLTGNVVEAYFRKDRRDNRCSSGIAK